MLREECAPLLARFEASDVYKRMSGQGEREASFSFLFEECLIEGKIDLLLSRGLVDFKSDDVAAADVDAHAEEYRGQMDVYALAFARMRGAPPDKVTLCFLRPERVVEWPYGADGVKRAQASLARVIAAIRLGPPFAPRLDCDARCEYARLCSIIFESRSTRGRGFPPRSA